MTAMPGCLVLIVGPSGAGKDTVMRAARDALAGSPGFLFPRRIITRPADATEDHLPATPAEFAAHAFALRWQAHGLSYGIPATIVPALGEGGVVVANVSRAVVAEARRRFRCHVVEITASAPVLAARLAGRGREAPAAIAARLARAAAASGADETIVNETTPEAAGARLAAILRRCASRGA
uniref:phosphonate metabolism protein/1,5-bisphosphokinase (PRPP-forming) PhnN n=1 Tax=Acidocella sp. C78 TaxID=1671486 RepID=UPI0027DB518D|nr:phosphonate metabolism protein/1,5-bisphosphokinase (PRPP-forming) PhnN [Acidocella sp. C78]